MNTLNRAPIAKPGRWLAGLLAAIGLFLPLTGLAQEPDELVQNWAAPPYWSGSGASESATSGRSSLAGSAPALLPFVALTPCRLVDTRSPVFVAPLGGGFLPAATTRSYTLVGVCNVPATAKAISLNATVTNGTGPGFLVLWPKGGALPPVSTLNFLPGQTIVNAAVVPLSADGSISVVLGVSGGDVILDTNGYYTSFSDVASLNGLTGDLTLAAGSNVTITPGAGVLTVSTSVPQGPAGPQGPSGLVGPVGPTGPQGRRVTRAPRAHRGPSVKRARGTGPQGPTGLTGATGAPAHRRDGRTRSDRPDGFPRTCRHQRSGRRERSRRQERSERNGRSAGHARLQRRVLHRHSDEHDLRAEGGRRMARGCFDRRTDGRHGTAGRRGHEARWSAGSDGATGPQGPKGDKGDTGATGAQGPAGLTGARSAGNSRLVSAARTAHRRAGCQGPIDSRVLTTSH